MTLDSFNAFTITDPESFVRGGPTLTDFFCFVLFCFCFFLFFSFFKGGGGGGGGVS